ncbi:TonB-dependent receptor [Leptospira sp. 201903074]|uniref:TonB-dependent receptor plug domain-containing protein n=1 Tax=Leptospira abararensis TaxID=2810036 RepID=UPI0019629D9D|nr:TonB-dependent receptor [Leptospira abararensis]MBM9548158.1 TonB-dependent receptor [Leptospira abararensis]
MHSFIQFLLPILCLFLLFIGEVHSQTRPRETGKKAKTVEQTPNTTTNPPPVSTETSPKDLNSQNTETTTPTAPIEEGNKEETSSEEVDRFKDLDNKNGIVVTGSRGERRLKDSAVATEVISRKRIEQTGARNLGEVLDTQIGINVTPFFGGSQVQMLGLDSKYVLFLVDGQRVAGRLNNTIDLTRFKVQNIERVEIVKGSSSSLYGADAIGGVINIITKQAEKPEHYQFRTTYGNGRQTNFGTQGEKNMIADVGFKNDFVATNFFGGFNQSAAYDLDPKTPATTGNAFQDNNVGGNMTFNPDGQFKVKTGINYLNRNQAGVDSRANGGVFDRTNLTNDFLGLGALEYTYGKRNMVSLRGNFSRWENHYKLDQRNSNELDVKELTNEFSSQGVAQIDHEINKDHMVTAGVESYSEELQSDRLQRRNAFRTRRAVFIQDEWVIWRQGFVWRLVPGVRHDVDSQFGGQTTPKIATKVDITSNLVFRASYGKGFRPPSFRELYLRFENPGVGYVVDGNDKLRPERSTTVNADLEYTPFKFWTLSLSVFRNDITDLIQYSFGTRTSEFANFQLKNVQRAYTRGVEAGSRVRFLKYFALELGYNQTDTRDLTTDRPLEGRALHQGTMNFFVNAPGGWEFALRAKRLDKRPFYSTTNEFTAGTSTALIDQQTKSVEENNKVVYGKPFTLLNVRMEKKFFDGRMSLFLGVDNVLDQYELTYNPIRPRFYYGGLQATF